MHLEGAAKPASFGCRESDENQILSDPAVTDGRSPFNKSNSASSLPIATPSAQTVDVRDYNTMSAADLNNDYDRVPKASDVLKATHEGLAMHRG